MVLTFGVISPEVKTSKGAGAVGTAASAGDGVTGLLGSAVPTSAHK